MEKCPNCKKIIPYDNIIQNEYIVLLEFLEKNKNDKFKYLFFSNLFNLLEKKINLELCQCFENLKEKKEKIININKEFVKKENIKDINTIFKKNYKINFLKNKEDSKDFYEFIKNEIKNLQFLSNFNFLIISYTDLINKIKIILESKETILIEEIKNLDLLVIYSFEELFLNDNKSDYMFYDEKIMEIIKDRYINNNTTYIIYNSKLHKFNNLVKKINNSKLSEFYLKIYEPDNDKILKF